MMTSRSTAAPKAKGPYATSRIAAGFLYLSGQGSIEPSTGEPLTGDIALESEQTLRNITALLSENGYELDDVVSLTCYLTDLADWPAMNVVCEQFFTGARPTRTAVGVRELPFGLRVEMTVVAHRDEPRAHDEGSERRSGW